MKTGKGRTRNKGIVWELKETMQRHKFTHEPAFHTFSSTTEEGEILFT